MSQGVQKYPLNSIFKEIDTFNINKLILIFSGTTFASFGNVVSLLRGFHGYFEGQK